MIKIVQQVKRVRFKGNIYYMIYDMTETEIINTALFLKKNNGYEELTPSEFNSVDFSYLQNPSVYTLVENEESEIVLKEVSKKVSPAILTNMEYRLVYCSNINTIKYHISILKKQELLVVYHDFYDEKGQVKESKHISMDYIPTIIQDLIYKKVELQNKLIIFNENQGFIFTETDNCNYVSLIFTIDNKTNKFSELLTIAFNENADMLIGKKIDREYTHKYELKLIDILKDSLKLKIKKRRAK